MTSRQNFEPQRQRGELEGAPRLLIVISRGYLRLRGATANWDRTRNSQVPGRDLLGSTLLSHERGVKFPDTGCDGNSLPCIVYRLQTEDFSRHPRCA